MAETKLKLSPSSLGLFLDCPRCFWLRMNHKLKRPEGPMSTLPGGLDLALKVYFDGYRGDRDLPPILEGKIAARLIPDQEEMKRLRSRSFGFWDESLEAGFYGMLDDCVIEDDGSYAPLDHKTRGFPPKDTHRSYLVQMSAYSLMLQKNSYPTSRRAYLVYYFPIRESDSLHLGFPFDVEVRKVETDPGRVYRSFADAVQVLQSDAPPEPAEGCAYCAYLELRNAFV